MSGERVIEVPDDPDAFYELAMERRWGDGLPLVPPTPERVGRFLAGAGWEPEQVVAVVPPRFAEATVEGIAANAVMAGCVPEALPAIVAIVAAMCAPPANLYGAQATTHPCGLMVMVNGPAAGHLGIPCGSGAFGPGFRGSATIGRAVRLILQNIGGAYPGETDRATQGSPAKFAFCFAENEAESPWPAHHRDLGFAEDESTVTVLAAEGPHNINDHVSDAPAGLVLTIAHSIATMGKNNAYIRGADYVVALGPEHARILGAAGWSKRDVQEQLFARARIPYGLWRRGGLAGVFPQPRYIEAADDDLMVPMADRPEDVIVTVVGGPGRHSCWIPSLAIGRAVTRRIDDAAGAAWHPRRPS